MPTNEHIEPVERSEDIPATFFATAWMDAEHPMAAVRLDNKFLHCNHAFERLIGYSSSEIRGRAWMEFTKQSHVGGDLASVEDVIAGRVDSYWLEKDYIHKRGHTVAIVLMVRRFPRESHLPLMLFSVEAPVATATRNEIFDAERNAMNAIAELRAKVDEYKSEAVSVHVGDKTTAGGDFVRQDKNGGLTVNWLVVAGFGCVCLVLLVLLLVVVLRPQA